MNNIIFMSNESNANSNNGVPLISTSYYNPFYAYLNGKQYELDNILFYDETGVKLENAQGWFGDNNHIHSIYFASKKPFCRKTKIDYNVKCPFIVKSDCNYETRYNLYLYIPDLPKFEMSYTKKCKMIMKNADIGLPEPRYNFISQSVKYLGEDINAEMELREACKTLDDYSIKSMTEDEFTDKLSHLKELFDNMKDAQNYVANYSVEDYLKEIENK